MNLQLKFVTDIIRPWERLNIELTKQNSIDINISDYITIAEDLAIKISHFPELFGQKALRNNKKSIEFNTIVDIADASKHDQLIDSTRNNKISISSMFEGTEVETFRFIRNKISVEHMKYGKLDFLETSKKAIQFLFSKLNLNILWNPNIFEAVNVFSDKVSLNIYYNYQIAWTGLQIEFFKRNDLDELIPYDPPRWQIELKSIGEIKVLDYNEYIFQLFHKSLEDGLEIFKNENPSLLDSEEISDVEFFIRKIGDKGEEIAIVKILSNECDLSKIFDFERDLNETNFKEMILVSKNEFSDEIKNYVSIYSTNIYLVSMDKQDAENIPLKLLKVNYKHSNIQITEIKRSILGVLKDDESSFSHLNGRPLSDLGDNFSLDKVNMINFTSFCLSHVKPKNGELKGSIGLNYKPIDKKNIYFKIDDSFKKIGVEVDFDWKVERLDLRMPILIFDKVQMGVSMWKIETYIETPNGINKFGLGIFKYGNTSAMGIY